MTLFYRCEMCSPRQSHSFDVEGTEMSLSMAERLVKEDHAKASPTCPATNDSSACVDLLVRMVQ